MSVKCEFCGEPVNPNPYVTPQFHKGWATKRRDGGLNSLRLREEEDRWACSSCIDKQARQHVHAQQAAMI